MQDHPFYSSFLVKRACGWKHLAHFIRELVDVHYPPAEKLVLVMDNLNTHTPSSLYQAFALAEARRILQKL